MSHEPETEGDDLSLRKILRSIDADAAVPDRARLEELRRRSSAVFDAQLAARKSIPEPLPELPQTVPADSPSPMLGISPVTRIEARQSRSIALAMRTALVAAASVVLVAMWFIAHGPAPVDAALVPFSKILDELRAAGPLEFQIVKHGTVSQFLVHDLRPMKSDEAPQRFEIATGTRLWRVDQNFPTSGKKQPGVVAEEHQPVDLLALLDVGVTDGSALLRARPVERALFPPRETEARGLYDLDSVNDPVLLKTDQKRVADSKAKTGFAKDAGNCLVYRVELPGKQGRIRVEAFVNERDHRLVGIFAWPAKSRRNEGLPLAEMRLIAMNVAAGEEKREVASSLTDDGRMGKVTQSQGIVVLRPGLAKRWTPVVSETLVKAGDWLRTERRGANAVLLRLSSDVGLTLGPGTQIEFVSPTMIRIHDGIVQVQLEPAAVEPSNASREFTVLAPRDGHREFKAGDKKLVRVDADEKLVDVLQPPVWLAGFEGTTNNESLGSLIVNLPDGRNEPLTVGYHHVSVEIRDQIARTTIEESFVNHTASRLEGIFHFPLPQDASISGFGMWIGNELVEADIVEKQRAREIYETILRERRDPGLLEWTGGNIFKARVFPIEARSEKRIKIVYTQVLPLRGNQYRYAYGLRSELLRTRPLRELSLTVTVNSALALKRVSCPTHAVRAQQTRHSARVEFAAQEYTPNRDFEVAFEIDGQQSDLVMVPHRRGDDGYFLVQITPPFDRDSDTPAGSNLREVIPEGKPLNLILLCDTSGSMDSEKRKQQSAFVDTVLSALGPDDRFQLAACDVGTAWSTAEPVAPIAENRNQAMAFLDARVSLGWTNLDRAFDDVLKKATSGSQIVYIGDGIVSSDDTDPSAFVQRLRQRVRELPEAKFAGTEPTKPAGDEISFHSIAVGNSYESLVLNGIASVGRGSLRIIGAEQTPQVVAREFLDEITRPGLRDIEIEFRGLKVAAVYPDRLPNLPAGTQQILVGRYLPELKSANGDQHGEVIVTGMRGSKKVTFAGRVSFKEAEAGNSFIPRLWARSHLDHLLAQGSSRLIQDEIIRLSEEFHIITPYTSLLVLETDADRARFGVQRRYEMRDGERFFAAGRENANFELQQQQILRAKDWRIGLRRQVLKSLSDLGRQSQASKVMQLKKRNAYGRQDFNENLRGLFGSNGVTSWSDSGLESLSTGAPGRGMGGMGGGMGGGMFGEIHDFDSDRGNDVYFGLNASSQLRGLGVLGDGLVNINGLSDSTELAFALDGSGPISGATSIERLEEASVWPDEIDSLAAFAPEEDSKTNKREWYFETSSKLSTLNKSLSELTPEMDMDSLFVIGAVPAIRNHSYQIENLGWSGDSGGRSWGEDAGWMGRRSLGRSYYSHHARTDYIAWIGSIFPALDRYPPPSVPVEKDPEFWSPDALNLARSLLRTDSLRALPGGIEFSREVEWINANWKRTSGRTLDLALYSPTGWLTRGFNPQEQTLVNYCTARERGIYSLAFHLGRIRATVPDDLNSPPLPLDDYSLTSLAQAYRDDNARVEPAANDLLTLILTRRDSTSEVRLTIDPGRHVVMKRESFSDGKRTDYTSFDDFVEIAGSWWATKVTAFDDQGRMTRETRFEIKSLTPEQFAERLAAELSAKPKAQFIHLPLVTLRTARQHIADGRESVDDRLVLIVHNAQLQQWDEMWKHVDAAEKLAVDKPGIRWIRTVLLATIRRNEEALARFSDEATRLAAAATQDEVFVAQFILGQASAVAAAPEFARVLQSLKPVYTRPVADRVPSFPVPKPGRERATELANAEVQRQILTSWTDREISSLDSLGRSEEAVALLRKQAEETPWERHRQELYANQLAGTGEVAAAHQWLRTSLARPEWTVDEQEALRSAIAQLYRQQARWADLLQWTTAWILGNPASATHDSAYMQHLSALIHNDQLDTAYRLVDAWFREARVEGKLNPVQRAKLEIAIRFAEGNVYDMNFQRMDDRWFEPLADTARYFARSPLQFDLAQRCFSNHYLLQSDIGDQLRGEWLAMLMTRLETLSPEQINPLVSWALSGRIELKESVNGRKQMDASEVPVEIWKRIADQLKLRWLKTQNPREKNLLGESLRSIYASRFADTKLLPFLRERIATAPADQKSALISALFEALLSAKWNDAIEDEAFARWRELTEQVRSGDRLAIELPALFRLEDAMLANRIALGEQQLSDQGELDKLTRKDVAKKKAEIRQAARLGLAERLAKEITQEDEVVNRLIHGRKKDMDERNG